MKMIGKMNWVSRLSLLILLGLYGFIEGLRHSQPLPKSTAQIEKSKILQTLFNPVVGGSALMGYTFVMRPPAASAYTGECICGVMSCSCDTLASTAMLNEENVWYNPAYERIYDTSHSSFIPARPDKYLEKQISGRKVVAIGEVHSNPCHHRLEFEVIKSLASTKGPNNMAIGLECFYRQHQKALDKYVFGHKDLAVLKYETAWDSTWGECCYAFCFPKHF